MKKIFQFKSGTDKYYPNCYFPIGFIFITIGDISPASIYGGTWELITDKFLIGAGNIYEKGSSGGSSSHVIKQENLPGRTTVSNVYKGGLLSYSVWTGGNVGEGFYNSCLQDFGYDSDEPISNMPPYLAVYFWKKISE